MIFARNMDRSWKLKLKQKFFLYQMLQTFHKTQDLCENTYNLKQKDLQIITTEFVFRYDRTKKIKRQLL